MTAPKPTGVEIRPAQESDCEALASIYQQSLEAKDSSMEVSTSPENFVELLRRQTQRECCLVVTQQGVVTGYGVIKSYSDRLGYRVSCETSIYLDRSQTGLGLGRLLQDALLDRCRELEYHHIVTKIWASNAGSLRFHQRFGFEIVGVQREVGYMNGAWQDVAILQLILAEVAPHRPELS